MVSEGHTAHGKVPENRFNVDAYYHPDPDRQGAISTNSGHFMAQDPAVFDAPFFSITAMEAAALDPQQRLLLELAYEGFENAGIPMSKLSKSKTSVYVGCFTGDYEGVAARDIYDMNPYQVTGVGRAMLSNRISWFFDLRGESLTLDTACSSSLYGVHLACQSLQLGETNAAVCCGSNLILQPDLFRALSGMRFLSADGVCHSFDSRANGYSRGEGLSAVILKRLSTAIADGDTIRAVIRATGLNQDGRTPGITMPSPTAQADLIRSCYEKAGLGYDETTYFEAHGTGTQLGDPGELSAVGTTIGKDRDPAKPLLVSSAKTNIGHQEGGAGLAGMIRAILALEKGLIPPLADFKEANPKLKLEDWKISLPTSVTPWPHSGLRRASVNSFGYGGANAHAILDDAYHYLRQRSIPAKHRTYVEDEFAEDSDSGFSSSDSVDTPGIALSSPTKGTKYQVFPYSAMDHSALERMFASHSTYLERLIEGASRLDSRDAYDLSKLAKDLAFTLADRRSTFDRRAYIVADSVQSLWGQMQGRAPQSRKAAKNANTFFVFTGQGAQYSEQGRQLMQYPVFRRSLAAAQSTLTTAGCAWDLVDEMFKPEDESRINQPEFSQPLCTALQLAQVDLLESWGITPKAVVGHSSGEIAAAYAYGALSHEDAMIVSYHRGILSAAVNQRQPGRPGCMMAVALSPEAVDVYLQEMSDNRVVVACVNSPESMTLSGDLKDIETLEARFSAEGVFARKLKVQTAYHSSHMQVIADDYLTAISAVKPTTPKPDVRMFSSVTSNLVNPDDLGPSYWVDNMLQPVQFNGALSALISHTDKSRGRRKVTTPYIAGIEIGPHNALKGPIQQILNGMEKKMVGNLEYCSLMSRGKDAVQTTLDTIGKLWCLGFPIDLCNINRGETAKSTLSGLTDLPSYPWQHSKPFWHESHTEKARRRLPDQRNDLLGATMANHNPLEPRWRNALRLNENPWLQDHRVQEAVVLPGAAMLVSALEAAKRMADPGRPVKGFHFRDIQFTRGLMLPVAPQKIDVALHVAPRRLGTKADSSAWSEFSYYSFPDETVWQSHCTGLFRIEYESKANEVDNGKEAAAEWEQKKASLEEIKQQASSKLSSEAFYAHAQSRGYQYGPIFQGVQECAFDERGAWTGSVAITDTKSVMPHQYEFDHLLHPTTLDCIIQLPLGPMSQAQDKEAAFVPTGIDEMFISSRLPRGAGSTLTGFGQCLIPNSREAQANIVMSDEDLSEPKIVMSGLRLTGLPSVSGGADSLRAKKSLELHWTECALRTGPSLEKCDSNENQSARFQLHQHAVHESVQALSLVNPSRLSAHLQQALRFAKAATATTHAHSEGLVLSSFQAQSNLPESAAFEGFAQRLTALIEEGKSAEDALTEEMSDSLDAERSERLASTRDQLAVWLDLLAMERPDMSVLLVGDGGASWSVALAELCNGKFKRCVLAEPTTEVLARSKAMMQSGKASKVVGLEMIQLDLSSGKLPEELHDQTFQLILAPPVRNHKSVATLRTLLVSGGRLVLGGLKLTSDSTTFFRGLSSQWSDLSIPASAEFVQEPTLPDLTQLGFEQVTTSDSINSILVTGIASNSSGTAVADHEVVFLTWPKIPDNVAPLVQGLQRGLEQNGLQVSFAHLEEEEKLVGRTIICFLELSHDLLANMDESDFNTFKATICKAKRVLWLTQGAQPLCGPMQPLKALATGLLRCLGAENEQMLPIHVDLSMAADLGSDSCHNLIADLIQSTLVSEHATTEREYAEKDGKFFVPRLLFDDSIENELQLPNKRPVPAMEPLVQADRALKLVIGTSGQIDSIYWIDDPEYQKPLQAEEVEIKSSAMSLNFLDLMAVLGKIRTNKVGCEIAGVVTRVGSNVTRFRVGQEVIKMEEGGFRTYSREHQQFFQEVPSGMTAAAASTLPTIYMTAYGSLVRHAQLREGETVLIHSAAGGLGQAAIQVAQWIGAEVFVTVGSSEKKALLMQTYGIPEDHIFTSRDASFAAGVKRMTKGRGVDVILNSLAGELLRQTWLCIADFGRFVEVGKRDIIDNTGLEMAPFLRNTTFSAFNLEHLYAWSPVAFAELLQETFDLVRSGAVGLASPTEEYTFNGLDKAFRSMQAGRHMGKLLVKVDAADMVPVMPRPREEFQLDPQGTYVLCGGLGGIGRSISRIMFDHGAGHIVYVSRSGASTAEAQEFMAEMKADGRRVDAFPCDTANPSAVKAFVHECQARGWNIKGFMQCAMALRNRALDMMTFEDWDITIKSKVDSTKHFHDALPKELDFFIMLASTSGILGAPSQGNYAAGNTYQDAVAHWRRSQGLSGTSLDFGVVNDVGYIAENGGVKNFDHFTGFEELHVSESDIHLIISAALMGHTADGRPYPAQSIVGIGTSLLENSVLGVPFVRNPKFAHLKSGGKADGPDVSDALRTAISESSSVGEAGGYVLEALAAKLSKAVGIPVEDIDISRPLHSYGVDSLVAVEIRNWFFRELKSEVALFDLLAPLALNTLSLKVASKSKLVSADALKADGEQVMKEIEAASPPSG